MKLPALLCLVVWVTVCRAASVQAASPDVQLYGVFKQQIQEQTDAGDPRLSSSPFRFNAMAQASAANLVVSASVAGPAGSRVTLQPDDLQYLAEGVFSSKTALDSAFPAGVYLFNLTTVNEGPKTINLSLPGDTYPPVPRVANFESAQAIDASTPFTVQWDRFVGGASNDYVLLEITDSDDNRTLFTTPEPLAPGALGSGATSVTLPAGTFAPGQDYGARLTFLRITTLNTIDYPGATGWSGYLSTTRWSLRTAAKAGVRIAGVVKGVEMQQMDTNLPVPVASGGYAFRAFVEPYAGNVISSAQLLPPAGQARPLVIDEQAELYQGFDTASALDAAFPDGAYTLTFTTTQDGTRSFPLSLAGAGYPAAPRIVNFEAAQNVDPDADFTVRWDSSMAGAADFAQLMVEDDDGGDAFMTGDPGQPGALAGNTTSVIIPAGKLALAHSYRAKILVARGTVNAATSSLTVVAAHYSQTAFPLTTKGYAPPQRPLLIQPKRQANGAFGFQIVGEAQVTYRVEVSTDLKQWTTLFTTNAAAANFPVSDGQNTSDRCRFYRVVVGDAAPPAWVTFFPGTAGTFGNAATPIVHFPISLNCYRFNFTITDPSPSAANQVLITGPVGTGQSAAPAEYQFSNAANQTSYTGGCIDASAAGPAGNWTVLYEGQSLQFPIPDPMVQTHLVIPVPTITISNGNLTAVQWEYRNASSGQVAAPAFVTGIQVQVNDQSGNRIYNSANLAANVTSHTLAQPLNGSNIGSLNLAYNDTLGNHYVVSFGR